MHSRIFPVSIRPWSLLLYVMAAGGCEHRATEAESDSAPDFSGSGDAGITLPAELDHDFADFDSVGVVVTPLDSVRPCSPCELIPILDLRVGERDGPGIAEGESGTVRYDPSTGTYAVVWSGTPGPIDLFDDSGRYLRSIGRRGEGPGEFSWAPHRFVFRDGVLTVMNYPNRGWLVFQDDGTLVSSGTMDTDSETTLLSLTADTALVAGTRSPPRLVSISSGQRVGELAPAIFGPDSPLQTYFGVRVARGRTPLTLATLWRDELTIREWSLDGELLHVIRGRPPGFPEIAGPARRGEPPPTYLRRFQFDGAGRLWLVSHVPADTWRDFAAALDRYTGGATGPVGVPVTELNSMPRQTAPRLDVFDLDRGIHLGTWVSEARSLGFLERDGEILVHQMEIDDAGHPFLAFYRFEFLGQ